MANDVSTNLNDKLLKEKIFNCRICDELCISDIFFIFGKGNVCSKCYEKCDDKSRAELNSAHIFVMSQLVLPCKYESKGCIKKLTCKNYAKHVNVCEYKVKPCPMVNNKGCTWNGTNFEIADHFAEDHKDHVVKGENSIFKVDTSLSEQFNIKLLIDDHKNCILKTAIIDNKYYYAINPTVQLEEYVEYPVKHISKVTQNYIRTVGTLTKLNSIYKESNMNKNPNATEVINLESLKHFADENNTIVNEFNLNPNDIDEKILELLKCPGCKKIMRPPIYLCANGHSICIVCHDKEQKCLTCNAEWTKTRTSMVEDLTKNLKYPCRYKEFGCIEFGSEPELGEHEESCPLHIYKCPMEYCNESGNYKFLVEHLNGGHKDKELTSNLTFSYSSPKTEKWTLFNSRIFKITLCFTQEYNTYFMNWFAELVCSNEDPSSYIYTVEMSRGNWTLIKSAACLKTANFVQGNKNMNCECRSATFNVSIKKKKPAN
ncbi:unnamed protein product [Brassicogethes aeneus]|uniref:RING-type E3 ubiquitin transferase n=1 Tax=Brassicogethes aeneus TaxID=1431903 RepID=A0A9P0B6T4_BRAAE|nr:unnamed protein product [Brassicogethes aeneus]